MSSPGCGQKLNPVEAGKSKIYTGDVLQNFFKNFE